jgi:regulatory protein
VASPQRALDPSERLHHALDLAYRHLAKRDRTVAEIRRHLLTRDVAEPLVHEAIEALAEQGYVDDERYARRFAEDRRRLDGWGASRIERRLLELGVPAELVVAAVASQTGVDELNAAVEVLRRRLPAPPSDARGRNRALGLLVRRGYDVELAHDAIRAHARAG